MHQGEPEGELPRILDPPIASMPSKIHPVALGLTAPSADHVEAENMDRKHWQQLAKTHPADGENELGLFRSLAVRGLLTPKGERKGPSKNLANKKPRQK